MTVEIGETQVHIQGPTQKSFETLGKLLHVSELRVLSPTSSLSQSCCWFAGLLWGFELCTEDGEQSAHHMVHSQLLS